MLLGISIQDFIINCQFQAKDCDIRNSFSWKYDPKYGNCFQFNGFFDSNINQTEIKTIKKVGKPNGLSVTLNLHKDLPKEMLIINGNLGATIKIDDEWSSKVNLNNGITYNDLGLIDLLPDFETNIAIERVFSNKLPKPYTNCEINLNDLTKNYKKFNFITQFVDSNMNYSQQSCIDWCIQEDIVNKCGCLDIESISLTKIVEKCYNKTQIYCLNEVYFNKTSSKTDKCFEHCPLECDGNWFDTYFSFSKIMFDNHMDNETVISSKLKVNIFYESLEYVLTTELPSYGISLLISNIGGLMSLFMGLSLLSLFEIIISFFEVAHIIFETKKNKINLKT